jgi:7-carboxy-7-deazaguanine synthase
MLVSEIFLSLQGEGPDSGLPMAFLRLYGCNLKCTYCDSLYAVEDKRFEEKSIEQIAKEVEELSPWVRRLCITGGEPLLQEKEMEELVFSLRTKLGFNYICIETNGTIPKPRWWASVIWDIDCKCPSSGSKTPFNEDWLTIGKKNRIKFVVSNGDDLKFVENTLTDWSKDIGQMPEIIVSPALSIGMYGKSRVDSETHFLNLDDNLDWSQKVWEFCVENNIRFSLQIHKVLWGNKKGV